MEESKQQVSKTASMVKNPVFLTLQVGMLGKNFSIQHFLIFPRNQIFDTNLHEVSDLNF